MPDTLQVTILSPKGTLFEGSSTFIKLPGVAGDLGVLANISSTLAKLKEGIIDIEFEEKQTSFFIRSGIGRLLGDKVIILTPFIESVQDINKDRAMKAKKRAEERLNMEKLDIDKERARHSLHRANLRLSLLKK